MSFRGAFFFTFRIFGLFIFPLCVYVVHYFVFCRVQMNDIDRHTVVVSPPNQSFDASLSASSSMSTASAFTSLAASGRVSVGPSQMSASTMSMSACGRDRKDVKSSSSSSSILGCCFDVTTIAGTNCPPTSTPAADTRVRVVRTGTIDLVSTPIVHPATVAVLAVAVSTPNMDSNVTVGNVPTVCLPAAAGNLMSANSVAVQQAASMAHTTRQCTVASLAALQATAAAVSIGTKLSFSLVPKFLDAVTAQSEVGAATVNTPPAPAVVGVSDDQKLVPTRRPLTVPSGMKPQSVDNEEGNLVVYAEEEIVIDSKWHLVLKTLLGRGSFGCVYLAHDKLGQRTVAVKIYTLGDGKESVPRGAEPETSMLKHLQDDPRVVQVYGSFSWRGHDIVAFEHLDLSLHNWLTVSGNRNIGLAYVDVACMTRQMIHALVSFQKQNIIHGDLKPENVMLVDATVAAAERKLDVKVIDFGLSKRVASVPTPFDQTMQTAHYRAPEIVLRVPYGFGIDMWSVACIVAELYTGRVLFNAKTSHHLLWSFIARLGLPPMSLLRGAKYVGCFFQTDPKTAAGYSLVSHGRYARRNPAKVVISKVYECVPRSLEQLIHEHHNPTATRDQRATLLDFLRRALQWDPSFRMTPEQALLHPFLS